jgi:hypothetical protein
MRAIITIIALCTAVAASGQIYIDSYRFGSAAQLLLDEYPGAIAAYSLRKLDADYSGNCVKIVRISDSDSLDIGFAGNFVDTSAIATFCSGTTCRVRIWYDQSGNNANASNFTNGTNQPAIYGSGDFFRINGKPCVSFNQSVSNHLVYVKGSEVSSQPITIFGCGQVITSRTQNFFFDGAALNRLRLCTATATNAISIGAANLFLNHITAANFANPFMVYGLFNGASSAASAMNDTPTTGTIGTTSIGNQFTIGISGDLGPRSFGGPIGDLILYNSDQSANRTGIQTNINNFYSIY